MGVPSTMALKSVLILAAIGLVYSEYSKCSAGNDKRDCTCADKAFNDCQEPVTEDQIHVADLAECKFQCDLFHSFGACDWFLYVKSGQDENCHLFGPGKESMGDYLTSCNEIAQPTRMAGDTCNGYVETGCVMKTEGTNVVDSTPTIDTCQAFAISNGDASDNVITFFKFGQREEECRVYYSGERDCAYQVADVAMDMGTITGCQTGNN